uniref:RNA polymerase subunit H/Rpb5 C-terminal domain-containing protein n=1 Tax=viral metagenome TaxID=1070528 RepID=A0A6C0C2Q4_9ZZZZ
MVIKNTNSTIVSELYTSRIYILQILESRGFNVSDYTGTSINEINILNEHQQLDLLLKNDETNKKVYVKYYTEKKIRPVNVYDFVEELYNTENILSTDDDLIIVVKDKPNDSLIKALNSLYKTDGIYVNAFYTKSYLYNILKHDLVPPHRILSEDEKVKVKEKFNITNDKQFPEISRFDPVAIAIGIRPSQLCEITRSTPTAMTDLYYRLCY